MNGVKFQHKSSFLVGEPNVIIGHKSQMTYPKFLVSVLENIVVIFFIQTYNLNHFSSQSMMEG